MRLGEMKLQASAFRWPMAVVRWIPHALSLKLF